MKRVFTIPERTHGPGPVFLTWQRGNANYLVTTGYDHSLILHDRHGDNVDSISLPGSCSGLSWDFEGDILAAICDRSPFIFLWDASINKLTKVDTSLSDNLTLLVWSKNAHLLAVGTSKGNSLIYNHQTSRKIPLKNKHSKKINSGCWSDQNFIALAGDDRLLTISNEEGESIFQCSIKGEASLVQFSKLQLPDFKPITGDNCISLLINRKSLFLLSLANPDSPIVLSFQEKYGKIIDYTWLADGLILVGFANGYLNVVSTNPKDIGQEVSIVKAHPESLISFAYSKSTNRVSSCSDNVVKFFDVNQLEDTKLVLNIEDEKAIEWMEWTDDGQLIALASSSGAVHVYLAKLTILGANYGSRAAYQSSLLEVTILNVSEDPAESMMVLRIDIEPSIIAIGPYHVVVCINNRAWFYAITGSSAQILLKEKEYFSIIKSIKLNGDYAAALFTDGKLQIHSIDEDIAPTSGYYNREPKIFNDGSLSESGSITTVTLTNEFLIYGTESGSIEFFSLEDWSMVNIYRHSTQIILIEPDLFGLRLIVSDKKGAIFLYNAIDNSIILIKEPSNLSLTITKVLWESWNPDKHVFGIFDDRNIFIYSYTRDSIYGQKVTYVGKMKLLSGQYPLLLYNGIIVCQTESGKTSNFVLSTHDFTDKMKDRTKLRSEFLRDILKLHRYQDAWKICEFLDDPDAWYELGKQAMIDLDIELALRVFRRISDAGMVHSLEKIVSIEEKNLLSGYVAMYLQDYDLAQKMFLSSSNPIEALEMRRNLNEWESAIILANRLAKDLIPTLSREYAHQLELLGDYRNALDNYEKAYSTAADINGAIDSKTNQHNAMCKAGIARTSIRCGNTKRGVELAMELKDDHELHLKCASLLESMKLLPEAAVLYELGKDYEKAARLFMNIRNTRKVGEIMSRSLIASKDIIARYAKVKEAEGNYLEAIDLYRKAGDSLNAVRLLLDKVNNPTEAVKIVKENNSEDGAKMIARFFQKIGDISSAIEFLVLSKCNEEAFQLASSTGQVDAYAHVLIDLVSENSLQVSVQDFQSLAIYYEQNKNFLMSGRLLCMAGNYQKGIKYLINAASSGSNSKEAINLSIEAASKSHDEKVIDTLIDYLMGENDGEPKEFRYLFRLYMALKRYREAAKTALVISIEEHKAGNYRNAHDLLFGMIEELKKQDIKIPMEMESNLQLVHSYLLAKAWMRIGDHLKSAQLLIRVSSNISKFPAYVVPILTSTVVECQRSGLKQKALHYATILMKPEYRDQIEGKFKRKIESLVRKSTASLKEQDNSDSLIGKLTNCPYCDQKLLETELLCNNCRNTLPYCIVTGYHISKKGITMCPKCEYPAIMSEFIRFLEKEKTCPMCYAIVDPSSLKEVDAAKFFAVCTE